MVFDALSISAIIISLLVVIGVFAALRRSEERTDRKLRDVAGQEVLFQEDRPSRELCVAIHQLYPNARPGLDYIIECEIPGKRAYIKEWNVDAPKPTDDQIQKALDEVRAERERQRGRRVTD